MFKVALGKKNLVGLDIGSSSIKAIELRGRLGQLALAGFGYGAIQPDTVVDGQIMELNDVANAITTVFNSHNIKTDRVVAGVSGHSVIIKNIILPQMSAEELEESIDWHAEEHIPFDIGDVSLDYQIVDSTPDSIQVLMAVCKRDRIANLRQAIQLAGKQPTIIDVDAFALQNCYEVNYQPAPNQIAALLNIGASTTNINILQGAKSVFTRDVTVGGNQYTALLQKGLGLTFEQAEVAKRTGTLPAGMATTEIESILETASDNLAREVQKTFDFYRATVQDNETEVQKIFVSGGGSKYRGLLEFLQQRFETQVEPLDPFRQIKVDMRLFESHDLSDIAPEVAVAVGLALRGVAG